MSVLTNGIAINKMDKFRIKRCFKVKISLKFEDDTSRRSADGQTNRCRVDKNGAVIMFIYPSDTIEDEEEGIIND
uniref:Uncharacterized protein n=1 Tax=Onchocerca volvulus TaxID=6282 RepID=A0A8R1Y9J3_ONCVO